MTNPTIRNAITGTYTREQLAALTHPVAWSGAVSESDRASQEADRVELLTEAIEALDACLDAVAVEIVAGAVVSTVMPGEINVIARTARPTYYDVSGGVDVEFSLTIDGETIDGECTLAPDHTGRMRSYGEDAGHWVDGRTLSMIPAEDTRDACEAIRDACIPVAEAMVN